MHIYVVSTYDDEMFHLSVLKFVRNILFKQQQHSADAKSYERTCIIYIRIECNIFHNARSSSYGFRSCRRQAQSTDGLLLLLLFHPEAPGERFGLFYV